MMASGLAAHTARNSGPILEVLRRELRHKGQILEIGSGTGQHATLFAAELPGCTWQTSDLDANHETINRWLDDTDVVNVLRPQSLDVRTARLAPESFDGVFSANSAHIMSAESVGKMFALVAGALRVDGVFCLYGPFRQGGEFNSDSNAKFHASLRAQDTTMGIRHLEDLDEYSRVGGLSRQRLYAMPANNHLAVWRKLKGNVDEDT